MKQKQELAKEALHKAREILTTCESQKRALTAEERTKYEEYNQEFDRLRAEILASEEMEQREQFLNQSPATTGELTYIKAVSSPSEQYSKDFFSYIKGMTRDLNISSDPSGGYVTPKHFQTRVLQRLHDQMILRQICTTISTESTELIPVEGAFLSLRG